MYIHGDAMRDAGGSGLAKIEKPVLRNSRPDPPDFLDLTPRASAVPRPPLAPPLLPDSSPVVPRSLRLSLRRSFLAHY